MNYTYDINIDSAEIDYLKNKLKAINDDLINSTETMRLATQRSAEFLSGNQFEKAKSLSTECVDAVAKTSDNIEKTLYFLNQLEEVLNAYSKYRYGGK